VLTGASSPSIVLTIGANIVISMDGTVPPVNELRNLKHKYNCVLLIDEAHSLLSLGRTGRECVEA